MIWRTLLRQRARRARSLPTESAGNKSEARIAIIAITTSNSISVKAVNVDLPAGSSEGAFIVLFTVQITPGCALIPDVLERMRDERRWNENRRTRPFR